jgi:hypothetical protein
VRVPARTAPGSAASEHVTEDVAETTTAATAGPVEEVPQVETVETAGTSRAASAPGTAGRASEPTEAAARSAVATAGDHLLQFVVLGALVLVAEYRVGPPRRS